MPPPWRLEALDTVASTNDEARRLALAGDPGRVAVTARTQTAGRGRQGRTWASETGGLYLSALLRPSLAPDRAGLLPLAAGLSVAEALEDLGVGAPALRWPNDVFWGGRKVAGVLAEARWAAGGRLEWLVLGFGVNVAQSPGSLAVVGGVTVEEALGRPVPLAQVRDAVLDRLDEALVLVERDPRVLVGAWSRRAPMLGQEVRLATAAGEVGGRAVRVEATGALVVTTPAGELVLTEGQVVKVRFLA